MDPYSLFPAELWKIIFAEVKEPIDWLNLYRADSFSFKELFTEQQVSSVLFSAVLPQVLKHLIKPEGFSGTLLPLRLASRHCKKVVDSALESSHQNLTHEKYKFETGNRRRLEEFLDRFQKNHPGNPIVGRSVAFKVDSEVTADLVSRFLSKFGSQLSQLAITDLTQANTEIALLRRLRGFVGGTPNLENLRFEYLDVHHQDDVIIPVIPHIDENEPMPVVIPRLKALALACLTRCPSHAGDRLRNSIVRICCNPDTLEQVDVAGVPSELILKNYPNLKSAKVKLFEEQDVSRLAASSWPSLSKLSLENGRISQLFQVAAHFKDTLTSLHISAHFNNIDDDDDGGGAPEPDLPLLKSLQVLGLFSFIMLKNLSNLQVLRIDNGHKKDTVMADIKAEVTRTNAWDMLPKLRQIEVIYERDRKVKLLR